MPVDEFYYLLGGMLDETAHEITDPTDELVQARLREFMGRHNKPRGRIPRRR